MSNFVWMLHLCRHIMSNINSTWIGVYFVKNGTVCVFEQASMVLYPWQLVPIKSQAYITSTQPHQPFLLIFHLWQTVCSFRGILVLMRDLMYTCTSIVKQEILDHHIFLNHQNLDAFNFRLLPNGRKFNDGEIFFGHQSRTHYTCLSLCSYWNDSGRCHETVVRERLPCL